MAVVTADHVRSLEGTAAFWKRKSIRSNGTFQQQEKGGYAHFMLKEIMEQPEAVLQDHPAETGRWGDRV